MKNYRTILLATALLPEADVAAKKAAELARENNARLILLHVMPSRGDFAVADGWGAANGDGWNQAFNQCHQRLTRLAQEIGVESAARWVVHGPLADEILRVAEESKADLIILGATQRGIASLFWGGTVDAVQRDASCDVLVVPATVEEQIGSGWRSRNFWYMAPLKRTLQEDLPAPT